MLLNSIAFVWEPLLIAWHMNYQSCLEYKWKNDDFPSAYSWLTKKTSKGKERIPRMNQRRGRFKYCLQDVIKS